MRSALRSGRAAAGIAAALAATLLITSCSSGGKKTEASNTGSPSVHAGHSGSASPQPPAALRSGERFVNLSMPEAYTPKAPNGGTDEYRCFLIDPKLTSQQYLTGSQFLPQNADIVHHAIFFRISPDDADRARQ